MAAAEYYYQQDLEQAHTPDHVPLLPVHQTANSGVPHPSHSNPHHHSKPSQGYPYTVIDSHAPPKPSPAVHSIAVEKQSRWTTRHKRYQRHFLALRSSSEILSILFSIIMFAIVVFVMIKFYGTKDDVTEGVHVWPESPRLWPTILLLAGALVTLLMGIGALITYCRSPSRARGSWRLVLVRYGFHIGVWLVIAFLYRYEKGLNQVNDDLWGWSCGNTAKKLQQDLHSDIDFEMLCEVQSKAWVFSVLEAAVKVLVVIVHIYMRRRVLRREKVELAEEVGGVVSELVQNLF